MVTPPELLVFDVNETLLDLSVAKTAIADTLGGNEGKAEVWFSTLLHHSLVEMTTGHCHDFTDIGTAALQMVAHTMDIALDENKARTVISESMTHLPPHADVEAALARLQQQGYRLVALSNSSEQGLSAQLKHAGINHFFERILSVQTISTYKPIKSAYTWACSGCDVAMGESLMIAAHGWDLCGAANAGMRTAFIARPGKMPYPLGPAPDMVTDNLTALADRLSTDR